MSDPFTMVYDRLWDLLEESSEVTALVKPKNRIKFNEDRVWNPIKDEISNADTPELVLAVQTSEINLLNSSSSSMITKQYQFLISTGNMHLSQKLFPLEFAIFAAMANWCGVLTTLRWPEDAPRSFVTRANLVSAEHGLKDLDKDRGIAGWSAVWTAEVRMDFRTSDLISYGAGTGTGT
jgi:hypothetical protein